MTCIVGLVDSGQVFMGGDAAALSGWDLTIRADTKLARVGDFLLGFCGSYRLGQILAYDFKPPPLTADLMKYMVVDFTAELRKTLLARGFAEKHNEKESNGGEFLVGVQGRLFRICGDYQVGESADGYDAVGCGAAPALGALHATRGLFGVPRSGGNYRVGLALDAAEHHNAGVRGPFNVMVL